MKKILLILQHEYITRVSKKSFVIMTLLGPILIGVFYGSIAMISYYQLSDTKSMKVAIHDPYISLGGQIENNTSYEFSFVNDIQKTRQDIESEKTDILLEIKNKEGDSISLVAKKSLSISDKQQLKQLISNQYFNNSLEEKGLSKAIIDSLRPSISTPGGAALVRHI